MNNLLKYLGGAVLLVGVALLAIPSFTNTASNTTLLSGLATVIFGYLLHIYLGRKID
ncbi:MAG: hypothetical protein LBI58_00805 [Tannerellaceae bacterium]|jgi:hypothetical protein|nr:hypothetical protein [Tannerellaceae bacterium]